MDDVAFSKGDIKLDSAKIVIAEIKIRNDRYFKTNSWYFDGSYEPTNVGAFHEIQTLSGVKKYRIFFTESCLQNFSDAECIKESYSSVYNRPVYLVVLK